MCPDKNLLSAYFDGELDERFALKIEAHISECSACREILAGFDHIRSVLHHGESPDAEERKSLLWNRLLRRFSGLYPLPVWKRRLLVPAPLLAAAAFLVIALGAGLFLSILLQRDNRVFDTVERARFDQVQFVSFEDIIEYLDTRVAGQAFIFTLPSELKVQFVSEPTLMKAADYKRVLD